MAIWSLTEERIDKLNKQIGDLDNEHKKLSKTPEKELWNTDLDEFIAEWDFQLEDEKKRAQKQAKGGRRASTKLRIGGKPTKKRAGDSDDDDDYDFVTTKATKAKAAVKTEPKKQTGLVDWGLKPKAKTAPLVNGIEQKPVAAPPAAADLSDDDVKPAGRNVAKKPAAAAPPAKKARVFKIDDESDGEDVFAAVAKEAKVAPNGRAARTVTKKSVKYNNSSDAMTDDGDFDVSQMVKGIGSTTSAAAKSLFTESSGRVLAATAAASKLKASRTIPDDDTDMDMEETNYEALIPKGSPAKPAARSARDMAVTDEDDSLLSLHPARTAPLKSNGASTKPAPKSKTQSPAAKAYAKNIAKKNADAALEKAKPAPARRGKRTIVSEDEDEDEEMHDGFEEVADDILDMDDEFDSDMDLTRASKKAVNIPPPAQNKAKATAKAPAKPIAKSKKAKDDDSDDEVSMAELDDLPAARPSRRAVASKKATYVDSEEDEDDEVEEDEEASEDYDDEDDE